MFKKGFAIFLVSLLILTAGLTLYTPYQVKAANPSADLDQCANDPAPSPSSDGCDSSASQWVNGNLGASKSLYLEGDSIPYRLKFDNLSLASHTVTIEWDTTKSSTHAIDYIDSVDESVLDVDPCLGVSGCSAYTTFSMPADPQVTGAGVTPISGDFRLYGGTITAVSAYSYPNGSGFSGDKSARISITFTADVANPVLAWGGHIATRADWGMNNSAVNIPGSPYHTRLIDLDGAGGNQDRSLSAEAVVFPGSITIIKQATPEGSTSFTFTASPSPLSGFSLVDNGTSANTKVFSDIMTFQAYQVNETPIPQYWGFDSVTCAVSSANGGSYSTSTTAVTINMKEGENWTCTYLDSIRVGTLTVIKHVVNDNGGSAVAGDWSLHVKSGSTEVSGSPQPGSESGTTYYLAGGTYGVSETGGPSGYSFVGFSGDCDSSGNVTVVVGGSKTCTLTNNDQQAYITVVKVVNNTHGGTAQPNDFSLTLGGNSVSSGVAVAVNPGTYTAGETQLSGYTFDGFSGDCNSSGSITIALGQSKTCTLTNSDQQAYVIVTKVVVNDNGGTAVPNDFNLTLDSNATTSGTAVAVNPGNHTAGETQLSGYTFTGFSGDCNSSGVVSVALGQTKTCTLTNNDQQAYVIVEKVVINNNGGTAQPDDFNLTLDGNATTSGALVAVNPGSHTAGETQLSGYNFTGFSGDCNSSGVVSVALGQTKTCTLTNNDQQAYITVYKTVINNNGGTAQPNDFLLTLSGNAVTSGITVPVDPGTYTAGETQVFGYSFVGFSGNCDSLGSITVALGESKTCTLTNNDIAPLLHLRKLVVNDNGGTATVADFTLTADGTGSNDLSGTSPVDSGANLQADTFALSETTLWGYSASAWACQGGTQNGSSVTLGIGEEATCTITNDDMPGTIIVLKDAKPATGSFDFVTTGTGYAGFTLTGDTSGGGNVNSQSLNAGTYTVQEQTQLGWVLTGIGGSSDPNTPYNCVVTGFGGSSGVGDLNTQTATITLKVGDTVTCIFENTGQGVTRTQGFWATHSALANIAWFGGTAYGHTFPGVAAVSGIGDTSICGRPVDTLGKLMGGFWADIAKKSDGGKRSQLDQARMQLLQQLLAAELNASAFGAVPSGGSGMFNQWENALCGTSITAIRTAQQQAASFNTQGDSAVFTPGVSADSKYARSIADRAFWDIIKQ